MGQAASYALPSVRLALARLRRSEVEDEDEVLRLCGFTRPGSDELVDEHGVARPVRVSPPKDEKDKAGARLPAGPLSFPPPSFGPLIRQDDPIYTLDELRAAAPFLPDGLQVDLNRLSLLYVLDADGDGRFSNEDIVRFVCWAVEVLPPSVTPDSLNEALQASCSVECFRRCCQWVTEGGGGEMSTVGSVGGPFQANGDDIPSLCSTKSHKEESLEGGALGEGDTTGSPSSSSYSSSSPSSDNFKSNEFARYLRMTSPVRRTNVEAVLERETEGFGVSDRKQRRAAEKMNAQMRKMNHQNSFSMPSFASSSYTPVQPFSERGMERRSESGQLGSHGSPSQAGCAKPPQPLLGVSTPTMESESHFSPSRLTDAVVHLSDWYLRLLAFQQLDRRREYLLHQRRCHYMMQLSRGTGQGTEDREPGDLDHSVLHHTSCPQLGDCLPGAEPSGRVEERTPSPDPAAGPETTTNYSIHAVEEVFLDLGVRESYDLSLWSFCYLLDGAAAREVEVALGWTSEEAMAELRSAQALDDALFHQWRQRITLGLEEGTTRTSARSAVVRNVVYESQRAKDEENAVASPKEEGDRLPFDHPSRLASPSGANDSNPSLMPPGGVNGEEDAALFQVPYSTLKEFFVCFIASYWAMLRDLRPDLFKA